MWWTDRFTFWMCSWQISSNRVMLSSTWTRLSKEYFQNIVESMPQWIQAAFCCGQIAVFSPIDVLTWGAMHATRPDHTGWSLQSCLRMTCCIKIKENCLFPRTLFRSIWKEKATFIPPKHTGAKGGPTPTQYYKAVPNKVCIWLL